MNMKTRSTFLAVLMAATTLAFLGSCSTKKDEGTHEHHTEAEEAGASTEIKVNTPQFEVNGSFRQQLEEVFTAYVDLKNAFISADAGKAKEEAKDTEQALARVDMKLLSGAAHNDWMTYLSPIESALKEIQGSDDIEAQRKAFSTVSDNLYKSIRAFGLDGKEAYYEYCPMAFNNAGAYWLSENEKIRNPYFGDKMLTCGEVKEKLQ